MKIGLVGWGIETQSAFRYFGPGHSYSIRSEHMRDDFPVVSDSIEIRSLSHSHEKGDVAKYQDMSYLEGLDECDVIVMQPTARRNMSKVYASQPDVLKKVTTAHQIFMRESPTSHIIGVTGSKGKSTVSSLVYEMLKEDGQDVYIGGNIGVCALDFIHSLTPDSWVVLELSSYQLDELGHSPEIAIHLMMTEEHVDWHGSMEAYVEAKSHLVKHQKVEDITVYDPRNSHSTKNAHASRGIKIPFTKEPGAFIKDDTVHIDGQAVIDVRDCSLIGAHNHANICAAVTAARGAGVHIDAIRSALKMFKPLAHHLDPVHTKGTTVFVNDSVATVPVAAISALDSLDGSKILLIGGQDRGLDITEFVSELTARESSLIGVYVFGEMSPRLVESLSKTLLANKVHPLEAQNITDVVRAVHQNGQLADYVLLAPGFPSYDMYLKYTYRGDEFTKSVKELFC
jgi:UDP-N-acetylmuramoylalanine--D-glutamate ligase